MDASNRFHAESGPSAATATAAVFDTSLVIGALATLATTGTRLILTFVCSSCGSSLLPQVEVVLFKST